MSDNFDSEFAKPDTYGGGPTFGQLVGRLLVISPRMVETVENRLAQVPGQTQERLTADVTILDGDPITHKILQDTAPEPLDEPIAIGQTMPGMWITNVGVVNACRNKIGTGKKVLGRLAKGTPRERGQRAPLYLEDPTPADLARAKAWSAWVREQQAAAEFATPAPAPVAAPAPAAAQYAQPVAQLPLAQPAFGGPVATPAPVLSPAQHPYVQPAAAPVAQPAFGTTAPSAAPGNPFANQGAEPPF